MLNEIISELSSWFRLEAELHVHLQLSRRQSPGTSRLGHLQEAAASNPAFNLSGKIPLTSGVGQICRGEHRTYLVTLGGIVASALNPVLQQIDLLSAADPSLGLCKNSLGPPGSDVCSRVRSGVLGDLT